MRAGKKKKGVDQKTDATVVTEDIVLGAKETNTPASLVVDKDGMLDIDHLSTTIHAQEHEQQPDPVNEKESKQSKPNWLGHFKSTALSKLLKTLRQPENWLLQLYYKSKIREALVAKFDWFSDFEGEQQLHNKLENVYGGTNNPVRIVNQFVKNNILVSLVVIGLSIHFIIDYVSIPAENRYADLRSMLNGKNENNQMSTVVVEAPSEPDYSHLLNHCAVTDGLREVYDDTNDRIVRDQVIAELTGFIKVYSSSEIQQWYAVQEQKRDTTINRIKSTFPGIQQFRDKLNNEITRLNQERAAITLQLDTINASKKRTLKEINKSIQLRTDLANLEIRISMGPSSATLAKIDEEIERIKKTISGEATVSYSNVSNWAVQISAQPHSDLATSVAEVIDNDIYGIMEQHKQGAPEAKRYRLQILQATLHHFGDLIGRLQSTSNHFEPQIGETEKLSNSKLRKLFGSPFPTNTFLNYDNCLTASNIALRVPVNG